MLPRLTLLAVAVAGAAALTTIAHGGASVSGGPGLIVFSSKRSENLFPQVYSVTESGRGRRLVPRPPRASSYPVPSPDGTQIALTRGDYAGGEGWIYVGRRDGRGWRRIGFGSHVAWSPDSGRLAFTRSLERPPDKHVAAVLFVADLATGNVRELAEGTHPSWSPDGRRIAVARAEPPELEPFVTILSATDGRTLRRLTVQGNPTWAPRGDRIAVVTWGMVTVVRENGTTVGRSRLELISDASWSPDATRLAAIAGSRLFVLRSDARRVRGIARARQRAEAPAPPTWSPDGTKIAYERKTQIHAIDLRSNRVRQVTHEPPGTVLTSGPVWSRSGRILYAAARPNHPYDLYTMRADGSNVRRLTRTRASEFGPAWSPDGRQIAFTRRGALFLLDVASRRARQIVVRGVPRQSAPTWSPDGSRIAFVGGRIVGGITRSTGLYVVPAAGGRAKRILRRPYLDHPRWSSDGKLIAFVASSWNVFVMRPDGRGLRKVAEPDVVFEGCVYGISAVGWASRNRLGFVQSYDCPGEPWPHEPTIKIVRLDGSRIASMPTASTGRVVWSRDGRWIVQSGDYGDDISENVDGDIVRMRADGSARVNLTHRRTGIHADWQQLQSPR